MTRLADLWPVLPVGPGGDTPYSSDPARGEESAGLSPCGFLTG